MSDQLALVCDRPNKRPRKTEDMRKEAAATLVSRMVKAGVIQKSDAEGSVTDIVRATRYEQDDGYKIARELELSCHWDCDMEIAEKLSFFGSILDGVYGMAEKKWAAENPMTEVLPEDAAVIWRGKPATVHGLYDHRPHCYKVRTAETDRSNSYFIVPFEEISLNAA